MYRLSPQFAVRRMLYQKSDSYRHVVFPYKIQRWLE